MAIDISALSILLYCLTISYTLLHVVHWTAPFCRCNGFLLYFRHLLSPVLLRLYHTVQTILHFLHLNTFSFFSDFLQVQWLPLLLSTLVISSSSEALSHCSDYTPFLTPQHLLFLLRLSAGAMASSFTFDTCYLQFF